MPTKPRTKPPPHTTRAYLSTLEHTIRQLAGKVARGYRHNLSNRAGLVAVYMTVCCIFRCPR
jgi:hypothetical protein